MIINVSYLVVSLSLVYYQRDRIVANTLGSSKIYVENYNLNNNIMTNSIDNYYKVAYILIKLLINV